ncbi:hypothetical protein [Mycobacteroides abscessus]|uniref:hypothetical protein n=1 Tax=Mycobacteroides abscessus TaxID=36809 RepID=UPI000C2689F1|nr:hypothetical protein [Mycobacteroides abscessus]RIR09570.1 hypothetical protein D2E27_20320 [Mycobacteroides abscessus]RIS03547.1 hypothetical protein D2E58_09525 [Mycobacteroides abscessus]
MTLSVASAAECADVSLAGLGFAQNEFDLWAPEVLAASLRRAASFLCPTTPRRVVDAVMEALQPLRQDTPLDRDDLNDLVEALLSTGDLVELAPGPDRSGRMLYLGPPSYVEKSDGHYLLLGIRPFGTPLLERDLMPSIRYERQTRSIELDPSSAAGHLRSLGVHPIARDRWVGTPSQEPAADVLAGMRARLDGGHAAGSVAGLTILDTTTPLRYYRSRWRPVRPEDSGDFVARRPQEYGADLWCYVRIAEGTPTRLIDFPFVATVPGRDEAWRLQAAIDAIQGRPHVFRIVQSQLQPGYSFVDFLAPVPTWAERYLELIGTAVSTPRNCLFSYLISDGARTDVGQFLSEMLWMRATGEEGKK